MTPNIKVATLHQQASALIYDLRQRINPAYANQRGTESYERRVCAEAIEGLIAENTRLSELCDKWNSEGDELREDNKRLALIIAGQELADYEGEAAELHAQILEQRHDNNRMFVELESLKSQVYAAAPRTIGDIGTACGEYVECSGRPDAPHGVDLEASFRTGRTVCVCKSWAPGEAS